MPSSEQLTLLSSGGEVVFWFGFDSDSDSDLKLSGANRLVDLRLSGVTTAGFFADFFGLKSACVQVTIQFNSDKSTDKLEAFGHGEVELNANIELN